MKLVYLLALLGLGFALVGTSPFWALLGAVVGGVLKEIF